MVHSLCPLLSITELYHATAIDKARWTRTARNSEANADANHSTSRVGRAIDAGWDTMDSQIVEVMLLITGNSYIYLKVSLHSEPSTVEYRSDDVIKFYF